MRRRLGRLRRRPALPLPAVRAAGTPVAARLADFALLRDPPRGRLPALRDERRLHGPARLVREGLRRGGVQGLRPPAGLRADRKPLPPHRAPGRGRDRLDPAAPGGRRQRRGRPVVAAVLAALLAAPALSAPDAAAWAEAVDWPLLRYAADLAEGEGRPEAGLLELDAATAVLLKVSVESDLGSGGYRVHNLDGKTVPLGYRTARGAEDAQRAALAALLERRGAELPARFSKPSLDWLAEQSAALAEASAYRPAAVLADWRFFGFRRGGVVDLPGLGTRSRAQTLKMLRALGTGRPERPFAEPVRAALRAVWLAAQTSAHETQYLLTGAQVRAAALALYPELPRWAAASPPEEAGLPWPELLAMARAELAPARRGRPGALWAGLDANAARLLADAAVLLARRGAPEAARPAAQPPASRRWFSDVTSSANFLVGSRDALDVVTAGASVLDYDKDGLPDLMVGYAVARGGTLWRNRGGMRFELAPGALGEGGQRSAPVDFDGDGWTDLLVLGDNESPTRLLRNDSGRFLDAGAALGFTPPRGIVESGVWFDADGDGDLDLYLVYLGRTIDRVGPDAEGANGSPNVFYLNDGGKLREATSGSGLEDGHWG
ncbi:VCBS repeat-containing protein, partial [bacterium]